MAKKTVGFKSFLPGILWFALMCVLFFMPGREVPSLRFLEGLHVDKLLHFVLFFVLIILLCVPLLKSSLSSTRKLQLTMIIGISAIIFGILTEVIQERYVEGRDFDVWDWVADTMGVALAVYMIERLKTAFYHD